MTFDDKLTRRDAAWMISQAAATAGGAAFFADWLHAAPDTSVHRHGSPAPPEPDRWTNYQPKFFAPADFASLGAFTEILIPTDATPGAREAHCAPFIDFVVSAATEYAPDMQTSWREAMDWLRASGFASMSASDRLALVTAMAAPERDPKLHHDGFKSYRVLKEMTVRAYYTSRPGLIDELEYQGMAYLTAFPGCDHPEHWKV